MAIGKSARTYFKKRGDVRMTKRGPRKGSKYSKETKEALRKKEEQEMKEAHRKGFLWDYPNQGDIL